ncbi:hypothetical protein [Methylobacterium marchantiae]|uniref:Chemotaxis methyl-accepting receptor HlyB-like 4HB MCP domain-containing protein n=1 Tax=Methylobacterium marchantiae TaxID=600331 RepID=A0ABW3WWZ3_9HYPH
MKSFNNLGLLVKIIIPLVLTAAISAGLVGYARYSMTRIADQTRAIAKVQAARQNHVLTLQISVTEATVQNRNILLEQDAKKIETYIVRQDAAIRAAQGAQASLANLADTPERAARNAALQAAVDGYFAVLTRSTAAGLKNDLRDRNGHRTEGGRAPACEAARADLRADRSDRQGTERERRSGGPDRRVHFGLDDCVRRDRSRVGNGDRRRHRRLGDFPPGERHDGIHGPPRRG